MRLHWYLIEPYQWFSLGYLNNNISGIVCLKIEFSKHNHIRWYDLSQYRAENVQNKVVFLKLKKLYLYFSLAQ